MIERMDDIIHQAYRVPDVVEAGNNLVLREDNNANQEGKLDKIKLNLKHVQEFRVYKFDEPVVVEGEKCECYAPFLQSNKMRAMCDFIVFFCMKSEPKKLCAWVVNLKSTNYNNNLTQMRAGHRLCEFLFGKFDDLLKSQDKPENLDCGHIDYVLFSLPKTKAAQQKAGTNPISAKKLAVANPHGKAPNNWLPVTKKAIDLAALARE